MFKNIICFPHNLGQGLKGVSVGSQMYVKHLQSKYYKRKFNVTHVDCKNDFFHNMRQLYNANKSIHKNDFRLNIGGDHSMSLATVAYSLNQIPHCKVVWVDAHADINTYEKSESKNFHGMPLAFLTGLDKNNKFTFIRNHLPFDRLLYIGLRSIDPFEQSILNRYNIQYILSEDVNNDPQYYNHIVNKFLGNTPFHLSLDVDCFDPSLVPHTGTTVNNGLDDMQGKFIIHNLLRKCTLYNMDLTEINPEVNYENLNKEQLQYSVDKMYNFIDDVIYPVIQ